MKTKLDLLKNAGLFSELNDNDLNVLARYSRYYNFNKGQCIFKEGSREEQIYIIKKGEVLISRHGEDDNNMDLARFIEGESFGELELVDESPRAADATAEKNTTLLIFPMKGKKFGDILQKHPDIFAGVLHKLLIMIAGRIRSTNKLISEKAPWMQDLKKQVLTDKLTGLYNRHFLEEDFRTLLYEYGESTSLIMIKPDDFKSINDNFGHEAGDAVLRMMADRIKSSIRESDIAVRYRGDEFTAVLPETDLAQALQIAEKLLASIKEMSISRITDGQIEHLTASVGVSTYPHHGNDAGRLIQSAFKKMFEARESGGNRIKS